jgi:uncharacterized protein with HEPN domain
MSPLEEAERNTRLWHIVDACKAILKFTTSRTASDYERDEMLRAAVERKLMIVGEAMARLSKCDADATSAITNAGAIVGLRNRIVHDYPGIDSSEVWSIVQRDLPLLLAEVQALLPS